MRTCVCCGAKRSKREMLRFVRRRDNQVVRDDTGHQTGRGAYACKGSSCIEVLMNDRRRLEKVFRLPREREQEAG